MVVLSTIIICSSIGSIISGVIGIMIVRKIRKRRTLDDSYDQLVNYYYEKTIDKDEEPIPSIL